MRREQGAGEYNVSGVDAVNHGHVDETILVEFGVLDELQKNGSLRINLVWGEKERKGTSVPPSPRAFATLAPDHPLACGHLFRFVHNACTRDTCAPVILALDGWRGTAGERASRSPRQSRRRGWVRRGRSDCVWDASSRVEWTTKAFQAWSLPSIQVGAGRCCSV